MHCKPWQRFTVVAQTHPRVDVALGSQLVQHIQVQAGSHLAGPVDIQAAHMLRITGQPIAVKRVHRIAERIRRGQARRILGQLRAVVSIRCADEPVLVDLPASEQIHASALGLRAVHGDRESAELRNALGLDLFPLDEVNGAVEHQLAIQPGGAKPDFIVQRFVGRDQQFGRRQADILRCGRGNR